MKKTSLIIFAFILFFSVKGFSQEKTTEQKTDEITKNMKSQINFSDDKYEKIYAINFDFVQKTEQLKKDEGGKLSKFKSLKKIDDERNKQLKEILSDVEFKIFEDNKTKNREAFKEKFKSLRNE